MLKKILLVFAVLIVVFLIIVALQPNQYRVARNTTINAPPAVVFDQINDFHKWAAWSPWEKLDPDMKKSFEGSATGTGSVYAWAGNAKAGEGRMTITESRTNDLIRMRLDFIKPFPSIANTTFTFKPAKGKDATSLTWEMTGDKNFISKAFCMFMNMDKMVGGDFERGLESLKSVVEVPAVK